MMIHLAEMAARRRIGKMTTALAAAHAIDPRIE
jgi:hypothetical protein